MADMGSVAMTLRTSPEVNARNRPRAFRTGKGQSSPDTSSMVSG